MRPEAERPVASVKENALGETHPVLARLEDEAQVATLTHRESPVNSCLTPDWQAVTLPYLSLLRDELLHPGSVRHDRFELFLLLEALRQEGLDLR